MRCELWNLLRQAAEALERAEAMPKDDDDDEGYSIKYSGCIRDVMAHIMDVKEGRHTVAEFAYCYCLTNEKPPEGGNE